MMHEDEVHDVINVDKLKRSLLFERDVWSKKGGPE